MCVAMKEVDPIQVLRAFVQKHGSQAAAARRLNISEPYLCDLLYGRRAVSENIQKKLNLRTIVVEDRLSA